MGIQGGYKHETLIDQTFNIGVIGSNAHGTIIVKTQAGLSQKARTLQYVSRNNGLEYVEFEMTLGTSEGNRNIVA